MKKGLFVLASLLIVSALATAQFVFEYGNYTGGTVSFLGITETTSEDLATTEGWFGAPIAGLDDSLHFTPNNFAVQADGDPGVDFKDSKLEFTIDAATGRDIDSVEFEEGGGFSLVGGDAGTWVEVAAYGFLRIEKVVLDDVESDVTVTQNFQMLFKKIDPQGEPWGDGMFDSAADGYGSNGWEGELKIDVDQILIDAGIAGKASQVYFVMDNTLTAVNQDGTLARIDKKIADGLVITVPGVPEPATMALLGLGALLLRRKK